MIRELELAEPALSPTDFEAYFHRTVEQTHAMLQRATAPYDEQVAELRQKLLQRWPDLYARIRSDVEGKEGTK